MRKLLLGAATVITSLGLTAGVAAADTSGPSIDNTGPDSRNTIRSNRHTSTHIRNDNTLRVNNSNYQRASSGDATVWGNTRGGDAESGDASNRNSFRLNATVDNNTSDILDAALPHDGGGGVGGGSISDTGPDSRNTIRSNVSTRTDVNNDNDISVYNSNSQSATSGDAKVSHNTRGGDAESGDATNTNSTDITLKVSN